MDLLELFKRKLNSLGTLHLYCGDLFLPGDGGDPPPDDTGDDTGDDPGPGKGKGKDKDKKLPDTGDQTDEVTFSSEQQKKLDAILGDRLERAKKQWEDEAKEAKRQADEKAEQERLKEQEKFKELSEKQAAKIADLETQVGTIAGLQEQLERYKKTLEEYVGRVRDGVPEYVTELLDEMDPVDQLTYLTEHAEEFGKQRELVPPTPKPKGKGKMTEEERRKKGVSVRKIW